MSLTFPSRLGDTTFSSPEAKENLLKLQRVDPRGSKDQVATRVALNHFRQIQELQPGYFNGLISWTKAGCVYLLGGSASLGAVGAGVYLLGPRAIQAGYGAQMAAGLATGALASWGFGLNPIKALMMLLIMAVRDAANRAANWSTRNDERSLETRALEAKECHKEIVQQLSVVYDDCAQKLHEFYEFTDKYDIDVLIQLKQLAQDLEDSLPVIENLMKGFSLGKHEMECVLQKLKGSIRFVQSEACKLEADPLCSKKNAELLTQFPKESMQQLAIPVAIQERVTVAKQSRMSFIDRCKGYGSSVYAGLRTAAITTFATAALAVSYALYQLYFDRNWIPSQAFGNMKGIGVGGAVAISAVGSVQTANKIQSCSNMIQGNADYVEEELNGCVSDLKAIYNSVKNHLESLNDRGRRQMIPLLRERLPAIQKEIQKLGIVDNPAEILGDLCKAMGR